MLCPCGSKQSYVNCCAQYIEKFIENNNRLPELPEQLMRSRFTAYALNNAHYIFATYAKASQSQQSIDDIQEWSSQCKWLELIIHNTSSRECDESEYQFVEFSAIFIHDNSVCEMREHSRFKREKNSHNDMVWRYLDGNILKNEAVKHISRNETCPCQNYFNKQSRKAKKYKHCCAR